MVLWRHIKIFSSVQRRGLELSVVIGHNTGVKNPITNTTVRRFRGRSPTLTLDVLGNG